jgi:hypothetical protein
MEELLEASMVARERLAVFRLGIAIATIAIFAAVDAYIGAGDANG